MKNAVFFWDKETRFVPHRKHISLRYIAEPVNGMSDLRVLMAVTMKNVGLWDLMSCGSGKNR
jgi:hypothetical protein